MKLSRRDFIALCSTLAAGCTRSTWYQPSVRKDGSMRIPLSAFEQTPVILVDHPSSEAPIAVAKMSDDQFIASVTLCTHRGCPLDVGHQGMSCPCHGSTFSLDGTVTNGPAQRALTHLPVNRQGDLLVVHPAS